MSGTIDERVVQMRFENTAFQRAASVTLSTLDKLKQKLNFSGASKGLDEVNAASNRLNFGTMAKGVDTLVGKFSTMSVIAITALANIATKAITTGAQLAKSLTIDPIKQGLQEYETNLNSIQTILANTQASGANLSDVTSTLNDLNTYSDKTIYNFSQMAKNIGTFTAAGVDLKTSAQSIKGIANLAALSGSNSEQASTAMYQLSQAIASGKVSLQDWNSVVNAGMGGTTFQRALAQTAVSMGTLDKNSLKLSGSMKNVTIGGKSFRDSISAEGGGKTWLTSDVLTKTLGQFTGDLTDAQLAAQGFNAEQIKAIQATAKTAQNAATEVKTLSGLMDTTKEAVVSGWSQSWQLIFGNFEEAKKLFTDASGVIGKFVSANANARNKILGDWKALGGRTAAIDAIKNIFAALLSIIKPIKEAFRDIFPAVTGKQLADITKNIRDFFASLKLGEGTAFKVKRIFQGFFALLDIGRIIIGDLVGVFVGLFGDLFKGSGGFLDFAAKVGDWITAIRYALKYGEGYKTFLITLNKFLKIPIEAIRTLAALLVNAFKGDGIKGMGDQFGRLQARLEPFKKLGELIATIWGNVMSRLGDVFSFMQPFADAVATAFSRLGEAIKNSLSTGDFSGILDAINTGLFGGLVLIFKKFMSNGINVDLGGGFLGKISEAFDGLTGSLKAMQQNIKADTLLKIAGAVGILTLSVVAISLIDSAALTKSLVAIGVMFTQLMGVMLVFDKFSSTFGALKLGIVAGAMVILSVGVLILSAAVKNLADLDWGQLVKGLTGVMGLLGAMAVTTQLMSKNAPQMIATGVGLVAVAVGVKILASAVKDFSNMSWGDMIKGFAAVGASLTALALFTRLAAVNKMGIANGVGLLLLAAALKVIASAVGDFGSMDWGTLAKGFAAMAVSLGLIAGAMALLPPTMIVSAAGLVVVAAALVILGQALKTMGGMSWEEIAKGLVTLAGGLGIIAAAMALMTGALPGAAALIVVAASLAILTPVLLALGNMSWEEIGKGLLVLVGVFTILGVAGLALAPVVPVLVALGIAIGLIGLGAALAGAGLFLIATGLTALSAAGAGAAVAITAIASAIIGLIPMAIKALAEGLVLAIKVIGDAAPLFLNAMVKVIITLLTAIQRVAPRIISTLIGLLLTLVRTIANKLPQFIDQGVRIITGFLDGISRNLPKVVASALKVVTTFLGEVAKAVPKLVDAGYKMIVDILNGISKSIDNNSEALGRAGGRLAASIIRGMVNGIKGGAGELWSAAQGMASNAFSAVKSFFGINSPSKLMAWLGQWLPAGLAQGIDKNADTAVKSTSNMGHSVINEMRKTIDGLGEMVNGNIDLQPTITPVLDLAQITKDAKKIGDVIPTPTISLDGTIKQANAVQATAPGSRPPDEPMLVGAGPTLNYTQNNYSPKALSEVEIYRGTKNQLSVVKEALNK